MAGSLEAWTPDLIREGVRYRRAFPSFYYVLSRTGRIGGLHDALVAMRSSGTRVIVDSGAFTFFVAAGLVPHKSSIAGGIKFRNPEWYHRRYLEYASANRDVADYWVELDVGEVIGLERARRWHEDWRREGMLDRLIVAYHPIEGETPEAFVDRFRDHPSRYVATESASRTLGRIGAGYHLRFLRLCYEAGLRAHGFATTHPSTFPTLPFYSVDSSSWKTAMMWGAWRRRAMEARGETWREFKLRRPESDEERNELARRIFGNGYGLRDVERVVHDRVARGRTAPGRWESYVDQHLRAVETIDEMERYYTRLWAARGVDWAARLGEEDHLGSGT